MRWWLLKQIARWNGLEFVGRGESGAGVVQVLLLAKPGVNAPEMAEELVSHLLVEQIRKDVAANPEATAALFATPKRKGKAQAELVH
jgi:hypothetical protein